MMTPTLFDIAAITELKPTGETYDPNVMAEDTIFFDTTKVSFTTNITYYHDKSSIEVSDHENISFLALWLSRCVFCSKSLQVAKKFLTMANQLHVGYNLCLSEMILVSLYESLGEGVTTLKNIQPRVNVSLSGPFWLLQLWLNATFETSLPIRNPIDAEAKEIKIRRVEGTRLALLTPNDEGMDLQQTFIDYIMMLAKLYNFTPSMAPFAHKIHGPEWFTRKFHAPSKDQQAESLAIWEEFLTPKLLLTRLRQSRNHFTLLRYQPNLVSR